MRPFAPSLFPHRVYLLTESDGADATASVVEGFPATSGLTPLPCRVRSTITRQYTNTADQEVSRTEARVAFPANPECKKGDRFQRVSDGLLLRVLAPARARDGDGALFVTECEVVD